MKLKHLSIIALSLLSTGIAFADVNVSTGNSRALSPDFLGFTAIFTLDEPSYRNHPWVNHPELMDTLRRSEVGAIRFPAGTEVNWWNWQTGWVDANSPYPMPDWIQNVANAGGAYTLNDLAYLTQHVNVTPIIAVNVLTDQLDSITQELKTAQSLGINVKYVELGIEMYYGLKAQMQVYHNGATYGQTMQNWMTSLKAVFPNTEFGVNAMNETISPSTMAGPHEVARMRNWNAKMISTVPAADALIVHFYLDPGFPNQPAQYGAGWGQNSEQVAENNYFHSAEGLPTLFAQAQKISQALSALDQYGKPYWVTEFTFDDHVGVVRGTWAHALALATEINVFLENPNVSLIDFSNFYSSPWLATVFRSNQDFAGLTIPVKQEMATTPNDLNATGQMMMFFAKAMKGHTLATALQFSGTPQVFGWLFSGGAGQASAIVVNLSGADLRLNFPGLNLVSLPYTIYSQDPYHYVTSEHDINRTTGLIKGDVSLPAYGLLLVQS